MLIIPLNHADSRVVIKIAINNLQQVSGRLLRANSLNVSFAGGYRRIFSGCKVLLGRTLPDAPRIAIQQNELGT
ncbi:MAG: hypothetical protein IPJ12_18810 [Betaproteobacteria bacterium]|jgi:hypothetical protein|nr:hypothetical protein [Betaproteobacteria bacterium]